MQDGSLQTSCVSRAPDVLSWMHAYMHFLLAGIFETSSPIKTQNQDVDENRVVKEYLLAPLESFAVEIEEPTAQQPTLPSEIRHLLTHGCLQHVGSHTQSWKLHKWFEYCAQVYRNSTLEVRSPSGSVT